MRGRPALLLLGLLACSSGASDDAADGRTDEAAAEGIDADARPDALADDVPFDPGACEDGGAPSSGFHVATTGAAAGDGSASAPWDLATALGHPAAVRPGDTIWVHGGTYAGDFTSSLVGEAGNPITVRAVPGEHVVIDGATAPPREGTLVLSGAYAVFRDLEVTVSSDDVCTEDRPKSLNVVGGPGLQLIHLVVHDGANVGFWQGAADSELYGCILYNNGWPGSALGHNLYTQNQEGTKRIEANVIFDSFGFGIHAYGEEGRQVGFELVGNVWFNNGVAQPDGDHKDDCLIGGTLYPAQRILLAENLGWAAGPGERLVRLGWGVPNDDVVLRDNYFVGRTDFRQPWASIVMTGNTFYGDVFGVDAALFPDNLYLAAAPTETRVFVRPDRYDPGRALIVVYNWADQDWVDVDVSGVLPVDTVYEVRNAQDFPGAPVVAGTYAGGVIRLPLDGLAPAQPVCAPGGITEAEQTGRAFNVFVLLPVGCAGA